MKYYSILSLIFLVVQIGLSQTSKGKDKAETIPIVLQNANIIDMVSAQIRVGDIFIKGDIIQKVVYGNSQKLTSNATSYDCTGKYIIPGLIDNHVHVTHGTLKEAKEHLEIALKKGVTAVRDMGGDGRMLSLLKRNALIGEYAIPDVYFSTIIGGVEFFEKDPRPQQVTKGAKAGQVPWQRAISEDSDFEQIIAEAKGIGATAIKIYALVNKELIQKVAPEAKKQGLKVWAHGAIPPVKPSEISDAGVEVLSHAGNIVQYEIVEDALSRYDFKSIQEGMIYRKRLAGMDWNADMPIIQELFKKMKQNDNILDATLFVYEFQMERMKNTGAGKVDSTGLKNALDATRTAYKLGVKIGAGSDHMISIEKETINIHRELELLVLAGLSNWDALRAATIINAETLGVENEIGTIEAGKIANLVVLNNNPLNNISKTRDIKYVIKRGEIQ